MFLTCGPEKKGEGDMEMYCDTVQGCDDCVKDFKLIEKIIGPNFVIQKLTIDEILDLKEV